jgi:hypothetical protein
MPNKGKSDGTATEILMMTDCDGVLTKVVVLDEAMMMR